LFFLSCKTNCRVQLAKTGNGLHFPIFYTIFSLYFEFLFFYMFCVFRPLNSVYCLCVNVFCCHRVSTQLHLSNNNNNNNNNNNGPIIHLIFLKKCTTFCRWNFSLTLSFLSYYIPGFESASDRNKYQECFLGGKVGRCVRLTTLPPTYANCLKILESKHFGQLRVC
jgi:hypothetical protein